jgi:hypothetical protein
VIVPPTRSRPSTAGGRARPARALIGGLVGLLLIAVACGPTTGSPTPRASALPSAASTAPDGSGGALATPWPGNAVLGIEALGAADGQIAAAVNDLNGGIQKEDLGLMRRAADGLAGLDVLLPNLDKINIYEPMQSFATRYGDAIRAISVSAKALRTAIDAKDAAGIGTSSQQLLASLEAYSSVQPELATWVEQSIAQRRLLLR